MNKNQNTAPYVCVALCVFLFSMVCTRTAQTPLDAVQTIQQLEKNPDEQDTIIPHYVNEDIINIINYLASLLNKNIFLPQGAQALQIKITYHDDKPLSVEQAWELVVSFLNMAGYSVVEKQGAYHIIKTSKEIVREGLPVYIGNAIHTAPVTDEFIIYVHYFSNMKVGQEETSEIQNIVKGLLPDDAKYSIDQNKNALVLAARTRDILKLVELFEQLDTVGFKEKFEFIKLNHATARVVADLFNDSILQQPQDVNRYRLDTRKKNESHFFSAKTRIIAYEPANALIVIGQEQAIERLKDFIERYIDTPLDSGNSVLHVYSLQYLDAREFAPVLEKIVKSNDIGSSGQARGDGKKPTGPERFFDEVRIATDKPEDAKEATYSGNNNLIIAARSDDWVHIKKIIEDLDTPKPQVFLEILIADLTIEDSRLLGALTRNPAKVPLMDMINIQSAQLAPGVIVDTTTGGTPPRTIPVTIAGDLAQPTLPGTNPANIKQSTVIAPTYADMAHGSTAISLNDNDGNTWSILQMLQLFSHSKILSHPHIVATDGKKAYMKIGQERLVPGDITGSIGSNTVQKYEKYTADLTITITPRISSAETVNLNVIIDIEDFLAASSDPNAPKNTRKVHTNANVDNESILTLGGLVTTTTLEGLSETPGLADVPILGWFFKEKNNEIIKNNLTIFISPTIIQPRLVKGVGKHTQDYLYIAERYADESTLFGALKDPITRVFFGNDDSYDRMMNGFMGPDQFISPDAILPEPKPREKNTPIQLQEEAGEHIVDAKKHNPTKKPLRKVNTIEAKIAKLLSPEPNPFTQKKAAETILSAVEIEEKDKAALLKELLKEEDNPFA